MIWKKFFSNTKHGTTILAINKNNKSFLIGDGQISAGSMIVKSDVNKLRKINDKVVCGFAGSLADCFTLLEEFEKQIKKYEGFPLLKPCVSLARLWRTEKRYSRLEGSLLICGNQSEIIELDGAGNVLTFNNVRSIGSGSPYAESAALALYDSDLSIEEIGLKSMKIASEKCCYTSNNFKTLNLDCTEIMEKNN